MKSLITQLLLTSWKSIMFVNSHLGIHWDMRQPLWKMYHIEQLFSGTIPALTPFPQSLWQAKQHSFPWKGIQELQRKGSVPFWLQSLWGGFDSFNHFPSLRCASSRLRVDESIGNFVINTSAHLPLVYSHCSYFFDGRIPHMYAYKWREELICTSPPRKILVLYVCCSVPEIIHAALWSYKSLMPDTDLADNQKGTCQQESKALEKKIQTSTWHHRVANTRLWNSWRTEGGAWEKWSLERWERSAVRWCHTVHPQKPPLLPGKWISVVLGFQENSTPPGAWQLYITIMSAAAEGCCDTRTGTGTMSTFIRSQSRHVASYDHRVWHSFF